MENRDLEFWLYLRFLQFYTFTFSFHSGNVVSARSNSFHWLFRYLFSSVVVLHRLWWHAMNPYRWNFMWSSINPSIDTSVDLSGYYFSDDDGGGARYDVLGSDFRNKVVSIMFVRFVLVITSYTKVSVTSTLCALQIWLSGDNPLCYELGM